MVQPREYKRTFFDRHGPDGELILRAAGYGLMIFVAITAVVAIKGGLHWWVVGVGAAAGATTACIVLGLSQSVGAGIETVFVNGSSTPYREQYSYQQSLVMRGKVDEALASFEALITAQPDDADVRIRAAELYAREKRDFVRAANLFRDARKVASITVGEDVYVTNRLVDLLTGPLETPGRALVELRQLIERYPGTAAADNGRVALGAIKARVNASQL